MTKPQAYVVSKISISAMVESFYNTEIAPLHKSTPQELTVQTLSTYQKRRISNDYYDERHLDDWFSAIEKLALEVDRDLRETSHGTVNLHQALSKGCKKIPWESLLKQLDHAINSYSNELMELKTPSPKERPRQISPQSITNLLYLIPSFMTRNPNISIDTDTGYCTATFETRGQGIMSILVTDKKEVNYFLVDEGVDIVKSSGTTKVRNRRDFSKFFNILLILDGK